VSFETDTETFEDRFVGCLLGGACGDILGSVVEGWPAERIREQYGEIRNFSTSTTQTAYYTDDTQMTIALTEDSINGICLNRKREMV